MSDIITEVKNLATRAATEFKAVYAKIGTLTSLTTTDKTSLVAALNELKSAVSIAASINDAITTDTTTWSSNKISSQITAAISALTSGAPTALDTLDELANALGDDANFAATITTALGNRVRIDTAAQGLTTQQKLNARTNIDVYAKSDIGDVSSVDFVATFNTGLL